MDIWQALTGGVVTTLIGYGLAKKKITADAKKATAEAGKTEAEGHVIWHDLYKKLQKEVEELQTQLMAFRQDNEQLHQEVVLLRGENADLRQEIKELKGLLNGRK